MMSDPTLDESKLSPSSSAFRELVGSSSLSPSMRTAALARLAATSTAAAAERDGSSSFPSSSEHHQLQLQQLLLAQQQQQQQRSAMDEPLGASASDGAGLHHLGLSPQVATLLAHQRLKMLQEQAAASASGGISAAGGAGGIGGPHANSSSSASDTPLGLAHLSTLGLLQQRQSEMLLAEQIRQHHGRLLASQLALHPSMGDALTAASSSSSAAAALLGTNGLPNGDHRGVPRSTSTASSSAAAAAAEGTSGAAAPSADDKVGTNHRESSGGGGGGGADGPDNDEDSTTNNKNNDDEDDNNMKKETDDSLDTFPFKLFRMLEEAESGSGKDIVSFNDKGRCFLIHKPKEFVAEVMPKYFTTTRMSSFQRQLNLYGFRRIPEGPDKGGYIHEHFIRGQKNLCRKIKRKKPSTKVPPPGLMYVNPSSLAGGMMDPNNHPSTALSVRQILADGQRSSSADQLSAAHQLAQLGNLGGLVGMYGVGNSTLSTALLLEQQQQQLRLRLHQQQQQADLMQHLLLRHQQERDLALLLQRHQQDPQNAAQGPADSHVSGAQLQQQQQHPGPR